MEGPSEPLQAAATGVRSPPARSPAGSPRGTSVTTPRALHSILVGKETPLPSCPWDSLVAQPKFPHPGFELSARVSVTASGAAGAPCHQRAVVAEERSPPSPCPWPSFHLLQRASPDPLEHSGTSRGFAVAPRNSSAVVMKVCHCHRCAVPHGAAPGPRGEPRSHPCAPLCAALPAPNPAPSEPLRTGARLGAVARPPQRAAAGGRGAPQEDTTPVRMPAAHNAPASIPRSSPCRPLALSVRNCEPRPSCGRGKAGGG